METALELGSGLGNVAQACDALDISRATLYRALEPPLTQERKPRPESHRALPQEVKQEIVAHLHSPRFIDRSPNEVYYTLLDEKIYLASLRSFYRILVANKESRDRRNQLRHPKHKKPELIASAPNVVWSWDISVPWQALKEMEDTTM